MEVKLIDYMGDDLRVVNAARVSFSKESEWEKGQEHKHVDYGARSVYYTHDKVLSEADQKLIKYLAKHNHWTPFSHVQITMREKVPIFVARQRFKHMVGFTYNEVSRRYVDDAPEFFFPVWREKPEGSIKQGSAEEFDHNNQYRFEQIANAIYLYAEKAYDELLEAGVAPEQARMVLPQSMYTEYYVTGSLAAWARAYKLRIDAHAQKEIQDLAKMWGETISGIKELEHSWKALTE